ncbi:cytochrome c [Rahnella bruchi]|uniref:c-type cytochrome n=1 Tax=Rahnella bruchi TaxID=1510573 RepID=UPI001FC954B2|nr:cytochrome c [Rahnella bruchi]
MGDDPKTSAVNRYLHTRQGIGDWSKDDSVPLATNSAMANGKDLYADNCAACHQNSGEGVRNRVPALKGNNGVQATEPTNILHVLMKAGRVRQRSVIDQRGYARVWLEADRSADGGCQYIHPKRMGKSGSGGQ